MKILDQDVQCLGVSEDLTVPDCCVVSHNKIGTAHGERKLYFGPKESLSAFFDRRASVRCFFLKSDLLSYMLDIRGEYLHPSQAYTASRRLPQLWKDRKSMVDTLDDVVWFVVERQEQIGGSRGYINSLDDNYNVFRQLALPNASRIKIMKLSGMADEPVYYWKFFVDYKAIHMRKHAPLVWNDELDKRLPGNFVPIASAVLKGVHDGAIEAKEVVRRIRREAAQQAKFRRELLMESQSCPITGITDERLLVASHIKPFECCETLREGYDPKNGFVLSPLYDKLFDRGLITFTDDRCLRVSSWLAPEDQCRCSVVNGAQYASLPIDDDRVTYLAYHRDHIFKG